MKRAVLLFVAIVSVIFVFVSPFSVFYTLETLNTLSDERERSRSSSTQMTELKAELASSMQSFDSNRTFEVHYSDVASIVKVLQNLSAVSIIDIKVVDPSNNFAPVDVYTEGYTGTVGALQVSMTAEDIITILDILDKMELPIYSLYVQDTSVTVVFLGGK